MAQRRQRYDDNQNYGPGTHDDRGYGGADWAWDVYDHTHEYENDWLHRFDESEGSTRHAVSSLFGNRGGRRRDIKDRLPRALRRGIPTEDVLKETGFFEIKEKVDELSKKIEQLRNQLIK